MQEGVLFLYAVISKALCAFLRTALDAYTLQRWHNGPILRMRGFWMMALPGGVMSLFMVAFEAEAMAVW